MICPRCGFDSFPGADSCARCLLDLAPLDQPVGHDRVEISLMNDKVGGLDLRPAITVEPNTTLPEVVATMLLHGVGAVLVIDENGCLKGILSERDLLMRAADHYNNGFANDTAGDFMTANPVTVTADDSLARALHEMDVGRYRHLPVVADGKPVGVVSVRDLMRYVTELCREK